MARRRPMIGGMRGGMPMRDGMMGRGGKSATHSLPSYHHYGLEQLAEHGVFLFRYDGSWR